jgi:4-oxalmesaconate hydratase
MFMRIIPTLRRSWMRVGFLFGMAKAVDPATGRTYDDTVPMVKAISSLSDEDRWKIFEGNARRLYTRARF